MDIKKSDGRDLLFLRIFLFISPLVAGGYFIAASAVYTVALSVYLAVKIFRRELASVSMNLSFITFLLLPVFYLAAVIWAVDRGTAVFGFVKFLPAALFAAAVCGRNKEDRDTLLDVVPFSAAFSGIAAFILSFVPAAEKYILVAGRLGGTFQYPNTFALYCLAGIAVCLIKNKADAKNITLSVVLTGLILLSGSRTVFVFLIITLITAFIKADKKRKIILGSVFAVAAAAVALVIVFSGNLQTVGRFLTISLDSSTFLGRLLYYKDALPAAVKHPFGMGYYGYYFTQGSFQTGVYSVVYVHSEPLQFMLDIGIIPACFLIFSAGKSFFSKNTDFSRRMLMFIILGHSCFDFDLQFISVMFVLILLFDFTPSEKRNINIKNKAVPAVILTLLSLLSIYFGTAELLPLFDKPDAAEKFYAGDTRNEVFLMLSSDDYNQIEKYADKILKRNKYVSVAYSAKANAFFSRGDIKQFIEYKMKAIENAPYNKEEYEDAINKIIYAAESYRQAGDINSADYCRKKILEINSVLKSTENKTDKLAWKIQDKPDFVLSENCLSYIEKIKSDYGKNN